MFTRTWFDIFHHGLKDCSGVIVFSYSFIFFVSSISVLACMATDKFEAKQSCMSKKNVSSCAYVALTPNEDDYACA